MDQATRTARINNCMTKEGHTHTKLAELLGITRQSLYNKLQGRFDWTIPELESLARIYHKERTHFF